MLIYNHNKGRLGNSIFRFFANIIFCIVYDINSKIINNNNKYRPNIIIDDTYFITFSNNILNKNQIQNINKNSTLLFDGYFQHDKIYILFKNQIINFIKSHPEIILTTDHNENYKAIELVNFNISRQYNTVVHLRLEDFIEISHVINPSSIKKIIDEIVLEYPNETICFVLNTPKTEIENKYINYLTNNLNNYKIETNDVITDFTIMRNAKVLVCSCSTLSWTASFLSSTLEKVYIPNYNNHKPQSMESNLKRSETLKEGYKSGRILCNKGTSKKIIVINPKGEKLFFNGEFTKFCLDNKLNRKKLRDVRDGILDNYKGWKCYNV
jgi:hypothetical protein